MSFGTGLLYDILSDIMRSIVDHIGFLMGYLDAASRTSLMQDLSDLQVTDIDLTGSTMTDAGYGNAVYLQITCKLPIEQLNMDGNDMLRFFFEDGTIPIRVRRMSTAKN